MAATKRRAGRGRGGYIIAFAVGAVLGAFYFNMSLRYGLDRVQMHWLAQLLGYYSLGGFDILFYEYMLDFGFASVILYFLWRLTDRKI